MSQVTRLTDKLERALFYASHVHAGQPRKETAAPYLAHLLAVAAIVLEDRGDEDDAVAALLHDAPEDQGGCERLDDIRAHFEDRVADIVKGCSDTFEKKKPPFFARKQKYIANLRNLEGDASTRASIVRVSAADKLHNLRAITADLYRDGEHVFCLFKGGKRGTLWYHACLMNVYRDHAKAVVLSMPLLEQLERAFATLQEAAEPAFRWPASERELPMGWSPGYDPSDASCVCGDRVSSSRPAR